MPKRKWTIHEDFQRLEEIRRSIETELRLFHSLDGYKNDTRTEVRVQVQIGDPTLNAVAYRQEIKERIRAMRDEKNTLTSEIQQTIQLINDQTARQVLQIKYLFGHTNKATADFCHLDVRSVYRVSERAMALYTQAATMRGAS